MGAPSFEQQKIHQTIPQDQTFYKQHVEHKVDKARDVVLWLGDFVGYGTILVLLLMGIGVMFKKRIKQWLKT